MNIYIYVCFSWWAWAHHLSLWLLALVCYGFSWAAERKRNQAFISISGPWYTKKTPLSPSRPNEPSCLRPIFLPVSIDFSGIMTSIRPSHWDISWYAVLHATKPWRWRDGRGTPRGQSSFHGPLFWCLWVPYSNCYLGYDYQQAPRVSVTNDPRGCKNRSCPSSCWHDDP